MCSHARFSTGGRLMRSAMIVMAALILGVMARAGETRAVLLEDANYRPPEPTERGGKYVVPGSAVVAARNPVIWRWQIEQPDGSGLAFGGLAFREDDPRPPTAIRKGGAWVPIRDDLRKRNPLQAQHDRLAVLLPDYKRMTSLARYIYLEGRDEAAERAYIEKNVAPLATQVLKGLKSLRTELGSLKGDDRYAKGQSDSAGSRVDKVLPAIEGLGLRVSHEKLVALRLARIDLERAIDALDAEPPARVLSMLAFDAKTGLYAVFGGDHFDYLSNDLWVFDPRLERWEERHPRLAPEPRGNHHLVGSGDGVLRLRGGYIYMPTPRPKGWQGYNYADAGVGEWGYDLAMNAWTGPAEPPMCPPDARSFRTGPNLPDHFTAGPRPDAAEHARLLAAVPANTWVDLKPPLTYNGERCWGTMAFDPDRDMIYWFNGGHSVWPGADVVRYHLSSNRWDQPVETEMSLGFIGTGYLPGWNFNRRAWICGHSYNTYAYHPGLKKMVLNGRVTWASGAPDANTYVYDPDYGDWSQRAPTPRPFDYHATMVRYAPGLGLITWSGSELWKLDDASLKWERLALKGNLAKAIMDHAGLAYDPKRKRMLFFTGGGYNGPAYSGEVCAVAIPSLEVTSFKPEGSEHIGGLTPKGKNPDTETVWGKQDVAYHPGTDLFIFKSKLPGEHTAAFDAGNNRWVGLKLPGPWSWGKTWGALAYDPKRDLIYSLGARGEVSVLRLDAKTLEIRTLKEVAGERR